jgi:hypothetical protein
MQPVAIIVGGLAALVFAVAFGSMDALMGGVMLSVVAAASTFMISRW